MLLKNIVTPGLKIESFFKQVRVEVANASGKRQIPWESSSLMGEFYFTPKVESQKKESEKPKLAYIPKSVTMPKASLRKEPKFIDKSKLKYILQRYDFFENTINPYGSFINNLVGNGDSTITDRTTGLMWQRDGSSKQLSIGSARSYLKRLNKNKLAGYSDWRLPTIEELASLLEQNKVNNFHISPLFDKKQKRCWSIDEAWGNNELTKSFWTVNFKIGSVVRAWWFEPQFQQSTYFTTDPYSYARAVRSVK
jgi:hypothetical protein